MGGSEDGASGDDDETIDTFSDVPELPCASTDDESDVNGRAIDIDVGHATDTTDFMGTPDGLDLVNVVVTQPNGVLIPLTAKICTRNALFALAVVETCPVTKEFDVGDIIALTPDSKNVMSPTENHKAIVALAKTLIGNGGVGAGSKFNGSDKKIYALQTNPPPEWRAMFDVYTDDDGVDRICIMSTKLKERLLTAIDVADKAKKKVRVARAAAKALALKSKPTEVVAAAAAVVVAAPKKAVVVVAAPKTAAAVVMDPLKKAKAKAAAAATTTTKKTVVEQSASKRRTAKRPADDKDEEDDFDKRQKTDIDNQQMTDGDVVTINMSVTGKTMTEALAKFKVMAQYKRLLD
jgi:hypothetical protein